MLSLIGYLWKIIKLIILIIMIVFLAVFFINNSQIVRLSLNPFPYEMEIRLFLLIAMFFIFGLLLGLLISSHIFIKNKIVDIGNKWKIYKLEKVIRKGSKNERKIEEEL